MRTIRVDFPAHQHPSPPRVVMFGHQTDDDLATLGKLARYAFGEAWNGTLSVILPARNETDHGFQSIVTAAWQTRIKADGVWYTRQRPGNVLAMPTADCPTIIGWQPEAERLCLAHGGRPALTPHGCCQCQTVLSRMANTFGYRIDQPMADVLFAVTPCISAPHFRHDFHAEARALVDPFRAMHETWPEYGVIADEQQDTLDLRAVVQLQLERWYRVPSAHIITHDACTVTDSALASRRAGDQAHNLTLVLF